MIIYTKGRLIMKKILISLTLVVIILTMFTVPVIASEADDIKAALAKIQAQFAGNEQIAKLVSDANTWLASPETTLPAGSSAVVTEQINAAIATAGGATTIGALSDTQRNSILGNISAAANATELTFVYSIAGSVYTFTLLDANGKVISTVSNNPIKQTGLDSITIIIIAIGVTVLFGAAIIIAILTGKKRQPSAV